MYHILKLRDHFKRRDKKRVSKQKAVVARNTVIWTAALINSQPLRHHIYKTCARPSQKWPHKKGAVHTTPHLAVGYQLLLAAVKEGDGFLLECGPW